MKRPIAAGHATALVLALAAGASHRQALPLASADAVPTSTPHPASLASSTWKQFEATTATTATAPAASVGGHHPHRRYGRMSVKEGGGRDASKRGNGPAGAVGGLWDNLRRRPRDREEDEEEEEEEDDNQKKKEEDGEDAKDDADRKDQGPAEATDTIKDDGSDKIKDDGSGKDDDVDKNAMPTEQQQQQQQQPSPGIQRTPMYIVRPRPPAGLPNHPGTSPLGGLLLPSGVGVGSGIGDPSSSSSSSSSQTVQSALLSALTKLLIATLLTPGGLRNSPLLGWLLPRRSGERPYLPDPVQRYTFERLNDRYERDGAALERALLETAPAADRVGHYFWGRGRSRRRRRRRHRHRSPSQQEKSGRHRKAAETSGGVEGTTSSTIDNSRWQSPQPQPQPQPQERGEHRTVIVLDFCTDPNSPSARHLPTPGHTHAPAEGHAAPHDPVELLRDQVSFVLEQYHDPTVRSLLGRQVEVVLRVESGGGGVQHFGVAADAVRRIRDAAADTAAAGASFSSDATRVAADESSTAGTPTDGPAAAAAKEDDIILTVCVDRIAASGGYMVAAQASRGRLFAAPFALVGSIGVYTERVNIHDALTRLGVRGLVLKAGKSKAPIGTIGEVSESGINAVQEDLDRVHDAFRSLVKDSRQVENGEALSSVMEGECFLGNYAQELGLVDRTITSDAYIAERVLAGDKVLRLRRYDKPKAFGGLNLPLSPLDLLLSGGASEDLFGRLKSKVKGALSAVNIADAVKFAGIILAGSLTFLKDFQHGGGHYAKTTGPQARYTQGK